MKVRAAVLTEAGMPPPYRSSRPLSVVELDLAPPGPGEAMVRVHAAGLCHSDLSVINGTRPRPTPMVLGHEAAGVVEEVGPGVRDVRPGDHVVSSFVPVCGACVECQSGRPALCEPGAHANRAGTLLHGTRPFHRAGEPVNHHLGVSAFTERTVTSVASLITVDKDVPLQRAALFGCAVLTGVGAVLNTARALPGTSATIFGLGGVGLSVVLGTRLAGCHPIIAVDTIEPKLTLAEQLGATETLLAGPDTVEQIHELTAGGAHYTFEAVGSTPVLREAYLATRRGGTTISIGLPPPDAELTIPALSLITEQRHLLGSYLGSAVPRRDIPRLLALHQAGRLPVEQLHDNTIHPGELNTAFDTLATGTTTRQILTFTD